MKVTSYFYSESERKTVFLRNDNLDYYLAHGWEIVKDFRDEGYVKIYKPVQVYVELEDDRGEIVRAECKSALLSLYKRKRISRKTVERFVAEAQTGKVYVDLDMNHNVIAFPR